MRTLRGPILELLRTPSQVVIFIKIRKRSAYLQHNTICDKSSYVRYGTTVIHTISQEMHVHCTMYNKMLLDISIFHHLW